MTAQNLLTEAAALADAAYADDSSRAEALGWRPLTATELGEVTDFANGVQQSTVGVEGNEEFKTAAHAYVGEVDGSTVVALAFRGTDQGSEELLFEIGKWEAYYEEHRGLVDAVSRFAADGMRAGTVDQLLITGHSLGAMLAEQTALGLTDLLLRDQTDVITFGSPGSPAAAPEDVSLLNIVHTDDPLADIRNYADDLPDWLQAFLPGGFDDAINDLHREGTDILVDRPEGRHLDQANTDELLVLLQNTDSWNEHEFLVEHDLGLYSLSAATLESQGLPGEGELGWA